MNEKIICTCDRDGLRWASLEDLKRVNAEVYTEFDCAYDDPDYYGIAWINRRVLA